MKFQLITLGKCRAAYVRAGIEDYQRRLKHYGGFAWVELPSEEVSPSASPHDIERALASEAERIAKKLTSNAPLVALAIAGEMFSSEDFSRRVADWQNQGLSSINFIIGSAHGLHESILRKATLRLSLSRFTLAHELAALVFTEQLYRAQTILRNEPYHK